MVRITIASKLHCSTPANEGICSVRSVIFLLHRHPQLHRSCVGYFSWLLFRLALKYLRCLENKWSIWECSFLLQTTKQRQSYRMPHLIIWWNKRHCLQVDLVRLWWMQRLHDNMVLTKRNRLPCLARPHTSFLGHQHGGSQPVPGYSKTFPICIIMMTIGSHEKAVLSIIQGSGTLLWRAAATSGAGKPPRPPSLW